MAIARGRRKGGNANTLRRYWENKPTKRGKRSGIRYGRHGKGGDFYQCVGRVSKYMTKAQAKGYCAKRHKAATGKWPGGRRRKRR
jgi:hypothetical protein